MRNALPVLLSLLPSIAAAQPKVDELLLKDGDRVVFLGGTFFEREVHYGYLEAALTAAHSGKQITFRNLGWSGDTVWAESRGIFDTPAKGYARLISQLNQLKPTVVLLAYGRNESYAGQEGREKFLAQYAKLIGEVRRLKSRIYLVLQPQLFARDKTDANWKMYAGAIRKRFPRLPLLDWRNSVMKDGVISPPVVSPGAIKLSEKQMTALRAAIVHKNKLYVHRYRPPNITYLYLFRKHEQGNNAKEIEQLDRVIAEQEKKIAKLKTGG